MSVQFFDPSSFLTQLTKTVSRKIRQILDPPPPRCGCHLLPLISHPRRRRRRGRRRVLHPSQLGDRPRPGGRRLVVAVGLAGDPAGDRAAEADAVHVGRAPPAARQVAARTDAVGHQAVAKVPERRLD